MGKHLKSSSRSWESAAPSGFRIVTLETVTGKGSFVTAEEVDTAKTLRL